MTRPGPVPSATIEIASIVCRLTCRYDKPILWAQQHPAFVSTRAPDVSIDLEYERRQRPLVWIGDGLVTDRPELGYDGDRQRLRTSYYDALVEPDGRRIGVRIQPGFGVDGLMRALWALLLLARDALLVRARIDGAALVVPGDGFVAVARRGAGWVAFATPFDATGDVATNVAAPLGSLRIEAAGERTVTRVEALARHVCLVDRSSGAIQRVLDLGADLVRATLEPAGHAHV